MDLSSQYAARKFMFLNLLNQCLIVHSLSGLKFLNLKDFVLIISFSTTAAIIQVLK